MRVIGLPGDTVEIRGKSVFVNTRRLEEPYARFDELPEDVRGLDNWGPAVLPSASYFVLGDSRDNSRDSRFWGFVNQGDLLGRAQVIYWSADPSTGRVRWERIARPVD
jgi:signal peptidase I